MEDHAWRWVAGGDSVSERAGDQFGAQVISDGVAGDAAGGDVDHGGQSSLGSNWSGLSLSCSHGPCAGHSRTGSSPGKNSCSV